MRAITFLYTLHQSEVYTKSYGPQKLRESQLWEFQDSHLGVLGLWLGIENTIKGEDGGFPQVWAMVSLVSSCLHVAHPCTKSVPAMH
jgi:hypothetical protein